MSNYVLDRAYLVEEPAGIPSSRAVVYGDEAGGCRLPDAANRGRILGVTTHAQMIQGRSVAVRRLGIVPCEAAGAVLRGDRVCVADDTGRVKAVPTGGGVIGTVGQDDAVRYTARLAGPEGSLYEVVHEQSGTDTPLSIAVEGSVIRVHLATDGIGDIASTANDVIAAVNADPSASILVEADAAGGAGTSPALAGTASLDGGELGANSFGIAEQDAAAEGDLIDVFLTP